MDGQEESKRGRGMNLVTPTEFPQAGAILRLQIDVRATDAFALRAEGAHQLQRCPSLSVLGILSIKVSAMGLIKEFKDFALKGNVVDMAVGIIIGGAFGKIVSSLVGDIMMPIIGYFQKGASIGAQFLWLGEGEKPASLDAAVKSGQPYIAWGPFAQSTIDFVIVAFALFMIIKVMNTAKNRLEKPAAAAAPAAPPEDVLLLREIRDALAKGAAK